MRHAISRRDLLTAVPVAAFAGTVVHAVPSQPATPGPESAGVHARFPSHDPTLAREMVAVSHGGLERVRQLLATRPALANAAWDWGFGDWETALGAASHTGQREIAEILMANGARPDIFTFAMLGHLDALTAAIGASPGLQRTKGPHGLTLMHHARQGQADSAAVVAYLEQLGGADEDYATQPLEDAAKPPYLGSYRHDAGGSGDVTFEITVTRSGRLGITRLPEGDGRQLYHLGNHEFHPAGAPAVRVRFGVDGGRVRRLTIVDGAIVLNADRMP